jgi:ribosomal protein S18 acetylase RimI-like enzyme
MKDFRIIDYRPELQPYFERLNKAWLEAYFRVEPIDEYVLGQPEEAILREGGRLYFAEYEGKIIGTMALKVAGPGVLELTKMAVDKPYQGLGAGKFLCQAAIEKARELGAHKLLLYSQTSLAPAIGIYRSLGFEEVPLEPGKYARADIKMELVL